MTDTRADRLTILLTLATLSSGVWLAGCGAQQAQAPPDAASTSDASPPAFRQAAWDDAGREATGQGLHLRIERVAVEPLELMDVSTGLDRGGEAPSTAGAKTSGETNRRSEPLLVIRLRLENVSEERKLRYIGWTSPSAALGGITARLSDAQNRPVRLHVFSPGTVAAGQVVRPANIIQDEPLSDVLAFEVPSDQSAEYLLELPAENFGGDGYVRLKIPAAAIARK